MAKATALRRVDPTTLHWPSQPAGVDWRVENAFPNLNPVFATAVVSPPGETNRLFCLSKGGTVFVITNLAQPTLTTFLSLKDKTFTQDESGLLGMAFHPDYRNNRYFYLFYCLSGQQDGKPAVFDRLARFEIDPANPNRALPESETPLITQLDEESTHNGGDLEFGPDGYLYVTLGDEGGAFNRFQNAWYLDKDFFSAVMRLDVDRRPGNLEPNAHPAVHPGTYLVPADNPFIGLQEYWVGNMLIWPHLDPARVRSEFWAIGFRNPWRMAFDAERQELYVNDVGQARREEVNLVSRAGNYAWQVKEGTLTWPYEVPDSGMIDPIFEYEHDGGRIAVTGAMYYRGSRYPELHDSYLFADYGGDIGFLRRGVGGWSARWFAKTLGISDLGLNPATGEILIPTVFTGEVNKLVREVVTGPPLPAKLSEAGIFSDLTHLTPAPGVVPYEINQTFWSDYALKRRWFALPAGVAPFGFNADRNWDFPAGAVWIKHFDIETERGNPATARRLETRVIVRNQTGVYGVSYRWNAAGTDAFLVPAEGQEDVFPVRANGEAHFQRWRFPARTECLACHTPAGGYAIGFTTAQLNRTTDYGHGAESQLVALQEAGYLADLPAEVKSLPRLAPLADATWSIYERMNAFFTANCISCHQPAAPNSARWDARLETPLSAKRLVNEIPVNRLESETLRLLVPKDPTNSVIYQRLAQMEAYHMPPLGTYVLNDPAIKLLGTWINEALPHWQSYSNWAAVIFSGLPKSAAAPDQDPDGDGRSNYLEFLLDESPLDPAIHWKLELSQQATGIALQFRRLAHRRFDLQWSTTPGVRDSWKSVDDPANAYFVGAEDAEVQIHVPIKAAQSFFRVVVSER